MSKERKKQYTIEGTPPTSVRENNANLVPQQNPLEWSSHQVQEKPNTNCKLCQKKNDLINKLRYIHKKEIGKLKQEKEKIEKEREAVKRAMAKIIKKNRIRQTRVPSTKQKVDKIIETVDNYKREEVKKKILFSECISRNLAEGFSGLIKKEKRVFSDIVMKNKENFKKHKIFGITWKFTVRDKIITHSQHVKDINIQKQIEDDSNTKVSPEKNEFITRNGINDYYYN